MNDSVWSLEEVQDISAKAFVASGASPENAEIMAKSIVEAEADALRNVGLSYVPLYCEQLRSGKINGNARPVVKKSSLGVVHVDAGEGFAHRPSSWACPPWKRAPCKTASPPWG